MFQPEPVVLQRYADIFVNFALNGGAGIKPGELVYATLPDTAMPLYGPLQSAILRAGGHPMLRVNPEGYARQFYELASGDQLNFSPDFYWEGLVASVDHRIGIIADADPFELEGIDPEKQMRRMRAFQLPRKLFNDKEARGEYTWTLGMYPPAAVAAVAQMSLQGFWEQLIRACYLDHEDPIGKWKEVFQHLEGVREWLNSLPIDRLHVEAEGTDLWLTLGDKRVWRGGSGRNIPSFEIFTSPDWRDTNGMISFNQPVSYQGTFIRGICLEFKDGFVIKATADAGQELLLEMLAQPNANKVGEFSLTDTSSRITEYMVETLFVENMGGEFGNTHLAVGMAYQDTYDGDSTSMTEEDWEELGFNDVNCVVHTDIVDTRDRTVTAVMHDGSELVIYAHGEFTNS